MRRILRLNIKKGSVLVTSLLVIFILLMLVLAYMTKVVSEYRFTGLSHESAAALNLAEAGAEYAIWELNYGGWGAWTITTDIEGNSTMTKTISSFQTSAGKTIGDISMIVYKPATGSTVIARATGAVPNINSPREKRTVKVILNNSDYSLGIFGANGVTFSGQGSADSYDSTDPLAANNMCVVSSNSNIGLSGQASILGNAVPGPGCSVNLSGQASVSGDKIPAQSIVTPDPVPPVGSVMNLGAMPTAGSNDNVNIQITKPVQNPPALYSPPNSKNLSLSSQTEIVLPPGNYYFSSVNMSSQAKMTVAGASTIYIDSGGANISGQTKMDINDTSTIYVKTGNVTISGQAGINVADGSTICVDGGNLNISGQTGMKIADTDSDKNAAMYVYGGNLSISGQGMVNNGDPENLRVYSTGNSVSFSGQSDLKAALYSPNAAVSISGQADVLGAIIAKSITNTGQGDIRYDLALGKVKSAFNKYRVLYWMEE